MSEIAFRAWDKKNKKMSYSPCGSECLADFTPINLTIKEIQKNQILLQYTGLHDRNGKAIYEGDILRNKCRIGRSKGDWNEYVEFWEISINKEVLSTQIRAIYIGNELRDCDKDNLEARNIENFEDMGIFGKISEVFEVIGNIYENEDLLNN